LLFDFAVAPEGARAAAVFAVPGTWPATPLTPNASPPCPCSSSRAAAGPAARVAIQVVQHVDPRLARALQNALDVERAAASLTGVAAAVVIPGQGFGRASRIGRRRRRFRSHAVSGRTPFPVARRFRSPA
jgi:hypothetical protein